MEITQRDLARIINCEMSPEVRERREKTLRLVAEVDLSRVIPRPKKQQQK